MKSLALGFVFLITAFCSAQVAPQAKASDPANVVTSGPSLVSLFEPKYAPIALAARIGGDVEVKLQLSKDGSVDSAEVVSGPPLLAQAALDSARQSHYECTKCTDDITAYSLVYSFRLETASEDPDFPCSLTHQLVTWSQNRITVAGEPRIIQPYFTDTRYRSIKCLRLWYCGHSDAYRDYYFYPVRSMKCLDLWNCGYQLREPYARCAKLHRDIW